MDKKGLIGKIILIVFLVLLVIGSGAGIYFYNYYVFKEIRVCVGEGENTMLPCGNYLDCLEYINFSDEGLDGAPQFMRVNFDAVLNAAVSCEDTCFVGMVRGVDMESGDLLDLENCNVDEEEFVMEIRGKEGFEALKWMKDRA